MYRCERCEKVVQPGVPSTKVITEMRETRYGGRHQAPERRKSTGRGKKSVQLDDPGGVGMEIVREILVCPECARAIAAERVRDADQLAV